jgi:hypothetical protein
MGVTGMTEGMQGGNRLYAGSFWHQVRKKPELRLDKSKLHFKHLPFGVGNSRIFEQNRLSMENRIKSKLLAKEIHANHSDKTEKIIRNPITSWIKESVVESKKRINFAVPFISSFSLSILKNTERISDKRIITRFDECSIHSFDLPTLKSLLDLGFEIRYDNFIHLKLYITDNEAYITSSNLTKRGFEDNIELTTKVSDTNIQTCADIFNEVWSSCKSSKVSYSLIEANLAKFEILRKRDSYNKSARNVIDITQGHTGKIQIRQIIDEAYNIEQEIIEKRQRLSFEANKLREATKSKLRKGFDRQLFYVNEKHQLRRDNLFHNFTYGVESDLAGTGLREEQFKTAFQHPDFEKVIEYMYPEIIGMKPWNFNDKDELQEFCNGIFDFHIPNYKETLPIRLASFFYPDQFLPFFKLEHLEKVTKAFGLSTSAETKGDRLYVYNSFLSDKMKALPYNNYIKSHIAYQIMYVFELYTRLLDNEKYIDICRDYKEKWKLRLVEKGMNILTKLKLVRSDKKEIGVNKR